MSGHLRSDRKSPIARPRKAAPSELVARDMDEVTSMLQRAASSPAAERIRRQQAVRQRQAALRKKHAALKLSDPRVARALELAAKHRAEAGCRVARP